MECYIDEEKAFSVRDRSFARPGQIALHSFMPAPVRYRKFVLQ